MMNTMFGFFAPTSCANAPEGTSRLSNHVAVSNAMERRIVELPIDVKHEVSCHEGGALSYRATSAGQKFSRPKSLPVRVSSHLAATANARTRARERADASTPTARCDR